ncbi:YdcF family protein [Bifidobacterium sp. W8116]|uniref:YdcF family protein n=2 Tax=Bifidobacterium choladohabitans TaxID=2750947 RepID=A0ABS0R1B2_9BIFI|nr:YdcF family protein [Bifidobacterium choladohabitans]
MADSLQWSQTLRGHSRERGNRRMSNHLQLLLLYAPAIIFGLLFLWDLHKEPRQFRNAIWLLLLLLTLGGALLLQFGMRWLILPLVILLILSPLLVICFLLANTVIVIRHEGVSLTTLLPGLLALAVVAYMILSPLLAGFGAPSWLQKLAGLIDLEATWFFFSFLALLLYSNFYRMLPRKRRYDYIIIHGAGLRGEEPTPLLRGRLDKAVDLWKRQGRNGRFVVSGGQGPDEAISEARAMAQYLRNSCGVPAEAIIMEDRSTTTLENLRYSKQILDDRYEMGTGPEHYRVALVTSDYHVFRASEYASKVGLNADGIGSHTKGYYWPTAFIREFVAITRMHWWPYLVLAIGWAVWVGISFLN